jgi:hypothetical protein
MTKKPALERPQELLAGERLRRQLLPVLDAHPSVVVERVVCALERVLELVALEDVVVSARLVGAAVLRVDRPPDRPQRAGLPLDPDHDSLGRARIVDTLQNSLGEDGARAAALHDQTVPRPTRTIENVVRIRSFLRNPFSFLFAGSSKEERVAQYVIREHGRGRRLEEILQDPYVRNRLTPAEQARLLDRPEVVHALGHTELTEARESLA